MTPIRLVAAVSIDNGVEALSLFDHSIKSEHFITIFPQIESYGNNYKLLADRATWHTSDLVKEQMTDFNERMILNVTSAPFLNGIELVFSQFKGNYRRLRLNDHVN